MQYKAPFGSADPDASYVDGNPATGTEGSAVPMQAVEHPQREIVHVITEAGLDPSNEDLTQLYQAIVAIVAAMAPEAPDPVPTGKIEPTYNSAADDGYVLLNGTTLGKAGSGAGDASADNEALFLYLWAKLDNAYAPVGGGRGASAQADWDAGKTITVPDWRGRAPIGAGQGSGLTNRALGSVGGEEVHNLLTSEIPSLSVSVPYLSSGSGSGQNNVGTVNLGTPNGSITGSTSGAGNDLNVMSPWTAVNWQIKK